MGDEGEDGGDGKGLFALPFMRRAREQQQRASAAQAAAVLRAIEAEVGAVLRSNLDSICCGEPDHTVLWRCAVSHACQGKTVQDELVVCWLHLCTVPDLVCGDCHVFRS